ncbi:MAG TPA: hypothetical protein ENJ18_14715 [Nannocystis exedens]|nr:hypothetical protein [Nannocystis exedens]
MTSTCFLGTAVGSQDQGHEHCAAEYGLDWSWLEFHDGEVSGWKATGTWINSLGAGERGWVWINNNGGVCWMNSFGLTWIRAEGDTCRAACLPGTGLEGPAFQPYQGGCNPYSGDTPCDECRRLICIRK